MKLRAIVFGAAMLGAGLWIGGSVFSQEKDGHAKPDMAEMMKAWEKYANPAEQHKMLAKHDGAWETTCKMYMPDMPVTETKGTATFKMELGGRFQRQDMHSSMMGMPYTGIAYTGYDLFKQKYTNIWMDSMGTMMMYAEGTASADGKTINFNTTMDDPMTGEMNKKIRYVLHFVDDNTTTFEMYSMEKTGEFKCMEMTYKRKATKS